MATDIDTLMDLDPLEMTKEDIDAIIAYHRNNRARAGADGKMVKPKTSAKPKVELAELLKGLGKNDEPAAPKPTMRRV